MTGSYMACLKKLFGWQFLPFFFFFLFLSPPFLSFSATAEWQVHFKDQHQPKLKYHCWIGSSELNQKQAFMSQIYGKTYLIPQFVRAGLQ